MQVPVEWEWLRQAYPAIEKPRKDKQKPLFCIKIFSMFPRNMQDFLEDRDKTRSVSLDTYGVRMAEFFTST